MNLVTEFKFMVRHVRGGFISLPSMLSLASFVCKRRMKEIGVRKVVGATQHEILVMLPVFFLKLSVAGFIIAMPPGLWIGHQWLSGFAYGIQIKPWMFFATAGSVLVLTSGAIGGFVVRASKTNPATILKRE
ncbi:MAG TPA: FtsX-like permease family protein [Chryseosolibacter sp.]